jgi:hypothetical protein
MERINKILITGIAFCMVIGLALAGLIHWAKRPLQIKFTGQPGEIRAMLDSKAKPLKFSNKLGKSPEKGEKK